jgi:hypothetical protein
MTKLVANIIKDAIIQTMLDNQYGFIRNRTIYDCPAWCLNFIYQCHRSKRKLLLLRLTLRRPLNWVKEVLTYGSYSILLYGVPSKSSIGKGESGKDILSPLLFVEVANLLRYLVNFSSQQGLYMPIFPSMVITQ